MRLVFLDAATVGEDVDKSVFSKYASAEIYGKTEPKQLVSCIRNADIVLTNKSKLTEEVLSEAEKLKLVCIAATGFDNVDVKYCSKHDIAVCNVKGYSTDSVAQLTVSLVLSLACHIGEYDRYCKSGKYTESGIQNRLKPVYNEISGKTWGLYGYGNIGKKVAAVARALGCDILVCKKNQTDAENA